MDMRPGELPGMDIQWGVSASSASTGADEPPALTVPTQNREVMKKKKKLRILVGIDLGCYTHQVCVLSETGEVLAELCFGHTAQSLAELRGWLLSWVEQNPSQIAVAIEKPHGAVVDLLVEAGIAVYAINPKQVDRFRDRHSVSGAKDDRRDAFVLADALRTDLHRFQQVQLPSANIIALREQLRIERELRKEQTAIANRLREQLFRSRPQLLKLAPGDLIDPFFWELLERGESDEQPLRLECIEALLRHYRIRRVKAQEVLDALLEPALPLAPGALEAAANHIRVLTKRLRLVDAQRRECAKQIHVLLNQLGALPPRNPEQQTPLTDGAILCSLPGVGQVVLATLLCEAPDALSQRDLAALRLLGGIAPVTKKSGTRPARTRGRPKVSVTMRRACNHALMNAFYHWARKAVQIDPRFKKHYSVLRARGHYHARALRGVMDRVLAVAMAMLRDRTLYDPDRERVQ